MNVLLITFSFPPAGGVGVLRALSLAKYLPESGLRVDVLAARNAPAVGRDEELVRQIPSTVTVHRTWTLDLPFALRKWIKKWVSRRSEPVVTEQKSSASPGRSSLRAKIGSLVRNLLLPDPQIGWIPFAAPAAMRIIRQREIDAVVITVPPYSSLKLVAKLRRRFPKLVIVSDFRDEWLSSTLHLVSFNSNVQARRVAEATESEAVRSSTAVVTVTEAARRELLKRYSEERELKFHTVSNGFDRPVPRSEDLSAKHRTSGPLLLTYMGSIYGSTDPTTFVEAVLRLPQATRDKLKVRFIGHIETPKLRAELQRLGPSIELTGFVPQHESLRMLQETDFVLLLSHDPINISAKLYDYFGAGKPILAAVRPEGEIRSRIEETRAGVWADITDPHAIATMLTQAISALEEGSLSFQPDLVAIARYTRRTLAASYAHLLKSLVAEERG